MPMGGLELVILLVIILLFFGAKRVPQLAKSLGVGARELKKAASEGAADESETEAVSKDDQETKTRATVEDGSSAKEDGRAEREARGE